MKTLYFNGDFVPMTSEDATFEALLVADDGTIAFTGSLDEARAMADGAQEVDLKGACVLPGLIDPHSHISGAQQYVTAADLDGAKDYDEIVERLVAFKDENEVDPSTVLMGVNYDHNTLAEGHHPNRHVLDRVSTEMPVVIMHASSHMCVCNSKLLELAGINAETPNPEGGQYTREEDGKTPTGYCEEPAAMWPALAVVQERQKFDWRVLLSKMQDVYLEHGITTCQDGAATSDFCDMFVDFAEKGYFKMDVVSYPMWGENPYESLKRHPEYDSQDYKNHFRFGGLKMFLDGSPQGRTAWLSEPYTPGEEGEGYCGYGTMSDEDVYNYSLAAIDSNHQVLAHTNGDQAAEQLLVQYKRAYEASSNPNKDKLRPVMVHCQTTRRDQYERMPEIHMIPSIFTNHMYRWADIHLKNFGPERGSRISAVRDAFDFDLHPTFHTDTPVMRPNFFESVWCAVVRKTKNGVQLAEDQKVSVFEGLQCVTINGAYQYGEEDRKGTLEAGKLADLCIVEKNPLKIDVDELPSLKVLQTIKEGDVVWEA